MKNKIVIITGANSGIGKATALALANLGATVVMISRNKEKGLAALNEIKEKTKNPNVELLIADMSIQKEIRRVASEIIKKYPKIDILINNAGEIVGKYSETVDGIETTFATNHLGYFILTNLLLDNIKAAKNPRIINVASEAERSGDIYFENLNLKGEYSPYKAYCQSKLANIIFTYELARRLKSTNISVNCMHPGVVSTNFGKGLGGMFGSAYSLGKPFMKSPEKGAETVVWLATSPDVEGITGKYFYDKKEIKSISISYGIGTAKKLWKASEMMTGLS